MTSLEEIAIEHIEKNPGVELPQDEKRIIREIISKHEFDEESARMFGEFYVNVNYKYDLPRNIVKLFNEALNNIDEIICQPYSFGTTYPKLSTYLIKRSINILDIMTNFFSTNNKYTYNNQIMKQKIDQYIKKIISLIYVVAFPPDEIKEDPEKGKDYLDILENIVQLETNLFFPGELQKNNWSNSLFNEFFDWVCNYPHIDSIEKMNEYQQLLINFLSNLTRYKPLGEDTTNITSRFKGLSDTKLSFKNIKTIIEILSKHDPEKESFFDIMHKISSVLKTQIPGYDIIDFLGEGAYKRTYLAKDTNLGHYVALKIIDISTLAKQDNVQRLINTKFCEESNERIEEALIKIFKEEARLMLRATISRSRSITQIYQAYYDHQCERYVIVEELGDQTLADLLHDKLIIKPESIYQLLNNLIFGVEELHKLGFVHGDLKPENILVNKDGTVRITDFGWSSQIPLLSEHYDDPKYLTNLLTCAPEIFDGKHPDKKSDIWSVGAIAYRMMTGEWPFQHGFTGTPEEWKTLPLEQKQKHAKQIREQMTQERISEMKAKITADYPVSKDPSNWYRLTFIKNFIEKAIEQEYSKREFYYDPLET